MTIVSELYDNKLIEPPKWLPDNVRYLAMTGSVSYGVSSGGSDIDIVGYCIPPKSLIFPESGGYLQGFSKDIPSFCSFQKHHIKYNEKEYDLTIYNIVHYLGLVKDNNPNMVDSLFSPRECILQSTDISQYIREVRRDFLHKGAYHKFLGFLKSQQHKALSKDPEPGSKRAELREKHGYDSKYYYHCIRLAREGIQILSTGDLDLYAAKEECKAVKNGELTEEQIKSRIAELEVELFKAYSNSKLPDRPDEAKLLSHVLHVLEMHYGSLDQYIKQEGQAERALKEIDLILTRNRNLL